MVKRQSYPSSLLFITTAVAALSARLLFTAVAGAEVRYAVALALFCGCASAIVGLAMGMHAYRRADRVASGIFLGFMIGAVLGPLVLVERSRINEIIALQLGGSALLTGLAVFFWLSKSDPLNRPRAPQGPPIVATLADESEPRDDA